MKFQFIKTKSWLFLQKHSWPTASVKASKRHIFTTFLTSTVSKKFLLVLRKCSGYLKGCPRSELSSAHRIMIVSFGVRVRMWHNLKNSKWRTLVCVIRWIVEKVTVYCSDALMRLELLFIYSKDFFWGITEKHGNRIRTNLAGQRRVSIQKKSKQKELWQ